MALRLHVHNETSCVEAYIYMLNTLKDARYIGAKPSVFPPLEQHLHLTLTMGSYLFVPSV